jgi:hypothetical protein
MFNLDRSYPKFIKTNKFFHYLELQGIIFNKMEQEIIFEKFKWDSHESKKLEEENEIFSVSSLNSIPDETKNTSFIQISKFFEWLGQDLISTNSLGLNENYLFRVVQIIKSYDYLKDNFFEKFHDLEELVTKVQEFLEIDFLQFENSFKFQGSTQGLKEGIIMSF